MKKNSIIFFSMFLNYHDYLVKNRTSKTELDEGWMKGK